jgi:cold shock CspA family protein
MKGIVESWDASRGRGWITPVVEPERATRYPAGTRIEVERKTLSPSAAGTLRPGQQVGFVCRAPETPEGPPRAESVVVISEPVSATAAAKVPNGTGRR